MTMQASGVFAAPAKIATNPTAAKRSAGPPINAARRLPRVAPMKKSGVTSPPLNPLPSASAVKTIFHHHESQCAPPASKLDTIVTAPASGEP